MENNYSPALIRELEERLLQPAVRQSAHDLAALLSDEFIEFGSSGRVFNKEQIIAALHYESPHLITLEDFTATQIAPGVVLATYRTVRSGAEDAQPISALRSSIWKMIDGRWQIIFHQGTLTRNPT